jgi:hypothetical protein
MDIHFGVDQTFSPIRTPNISNNLAVSSSLRDGTCTVQKCTCTIVHVSQVPDIRISITQAHHGIADIFKCLE